MKMTPISHYSRRNFNFRSLLSFTWIAVILLLSSAQAQMASDTPVFHAPGAQRGHLANCPRYRRMSLEDKAKMQTISLGELEKRGALLCSRCPGSDTPGRGNPGTAEGGGAPAPAPAQDLPESWVEAAPAEITTHTFTPSPRAPLISMGADGRLVYRPFSDRGDRLMDWSYCGYKNSNVPIPMVRVVETLEPLPGTPSPTDNLKYPMGPDSRSRIQDAIDNVAAMPPDADGVRGAVLLKSGTYYINGSLNVKSGVVLRGEGDSDKGTLLILRDARGGDNAIILGTPGATIDSSRREEAVRITDNYLPSGSLRLNVEDTSGFKAGDSVNVTKTVNEAWIEILGMGQRLQHIRGGVEGSRKRPWSAGAYQLSHTRQIVAVEGNTLILDGVLPQSFDQAHGGGMVFPVSLEALGTHAGIESLQVISNYATSPTGRGKQANFFNFRNGIIVTGTSDSWVRNVTVKHVSRSAVQTSHGSRRVTVRDTKCLEPIGPYAGGFRYAFNIAGGTQHLFYNCFSEDGRHDFSLGSRQTGPFAFVKCTAVRGEQSEPHHRWSTGALYDNVVTRDGTLAAINRGDSGSGHGWSAANTLFWNCDAKSIVVMNPETEGENNFAIGYRGTYNPATGPTALRYANTRAGYWGTPQEGQYFGYALMGSGHIESPDRPVTPDSLFVQQLIERIGAEQAALVLRGKD